ncbi:MAG: cell division protein ZapA [Anaerolineales bacterium]
MPDKKLSNYFKVRSRYQRSIHLSRDWDEQKGIKEYLLSSTAKEVIKQIVFGLSSPEGPKTWSITGPFGTGKSAFALFLTDMLSNEPPIHPDVKTIRNEFRIHNKPLLPILVVGQRENIISSLVVAFEKSIKPISNDLSTKAQKLRRHKSINNLDVISLFEEGAKEAREADLGGLLVIIDEFGKYLEYAANNPGEVDLLLLQNLAEVAPRSNIPIVLITILHSAFADYFTSFDETRRSEWKKIQGRFSDISFLEPPEQFLRLIGAALGIDDLPNEAKKNYNSQLLKDLENPAFSDAKRKIPLNSLIPQCVPLHPITALILWPLFRSSLAQNERSLFSFLNDFGPYGFQEFLQREYKKKNPPLYRISSLYNYVTFTLGDALFLGVYARRWAELHQALDRISSNAPTLTSDVVKAVGLISMFGPPVGLRASKEIIMLALGKNDEVSEAIEYLEKASIIIFRKFDQAYGLWEGSDVDLDKAFSEAQIHTQQGHLASRIKQVFNLQPIVARAHYIKTGTLRYFDVDVIDGSTEELEDISSREEKTSGDGRIIFVLTTNQKERDKLIALVTELTNKNPLNIYAFPKPIKGLEKALISFESWKWVKNNTSELIGDAVARNEVNAQIQNAQRNLEKIAGTTLGLRGYLFEPKASMWIQGGHTVGIQTPIEFQRWLSEICNSVFSLAPILHNELLNRENLSSAATAARRKLIEAMIVQGNEINLGMNGFPPEFSMYRSLLEEGGFHKKRGNRHIEFGLPTKPWRPVWYAMRDFLNTTRKGRRPILELYEILKAPPYGLREGPIPVLLCAMLLVKRNQVALYEDGVFVPQIRIEVLEILIRVPESFEIQLYELKGKTQEAFSAVGNVLKSLRLMHEKLAEVELLDVVKPLVMFVAGLPDFTKKTQRIFPASVAAVRDAILKASDPYKLLFVELPEATDEKLRGHNSIDRFSKQLEKSLVALQRAYPKMLDEIEGQFRTAFDLHGSANDVREQLVLRAGPLEGYAVDRTLALFIKETKRLEERDWREVLARVVNGGIPPEKWLDRDIVDFQLKLLQIASDFTRLEELVAERGHSGASKIFRIGVINGQMEELRAVVSVLPEEASDIKEIANEIDEILNNIELDGKNINRIRIAALAQIASRYLDKDREEEK